MTKPTPLEAATYRRGARHLLGHGSRGDQAVREALIRIGVDIDGDAIGRHVPPRGTYQRAMLELKVALRRLARATLAALPSPIRRILR